MSSVRHGTNLGFYFLDPPGGLGNVFALIESQPAGSHAVAVGGFVIPKGSNVVPFRVCYGFGVRDYNRVPKKELRRRVWAIFFKGV